MLKFLICLLFLSCFLVSCGGSKEASSHDFIDLDTNYTFSNVLENMDNHFSETLTSYSDVCGADADNRVFAISALCADVSCPLRGLDIDGCIEHCKELLMVFNEKCPDRD